MSGIIDILLDTIIDILVIIPFLFIAFLIIELIEHKLSEETKKVIEKSGRLGPLFGSALGVIPQCGFSVLATNLYVTRIISLGTLIAVYLSTSDEMLPIMVSQKVSINIILSLLLTKFIIGIICGFIIDLIIRKRNDKHKKVIRKDYSICHDEHCNCGKRNIVLSSVKHTLKTLAFIFIISLILNFIMEYSGNDIIEKTFLKDTILSPFISSLIGLIPNCGASIALTELYLNNVLSFASVVSGLLTGSGVALLVLFRINKNLKDNLIILGLVYLIGSVSGLIIELFGLFI